MTRAFLGVRVNNPSHTLKRLILQIKNEKLPWTFHPLQTIMKTNQFAAFSALVVTVGALSPSRVQCQTSLPGLSGTITAQQSQVLVGQRPTLTWNINYPSVVKDYIDIVNPGGGGGSGGGGVGTITPRQNLYADVRIIGQGVTGTSSRSPGYYFVPTEASMSIDSTSNFKRIFYGINPDVQSGNPIPISSIFGTTYANNLIQSGKSIRFGGRYFVNNAWSNYYKSSDGTDNIRFLVNGDTPPSNVPLYNAPSLESFLRPYLDTTGKVKIGPMDVIVFMELTHTAAQKSNGGYDLQDMVLLVTFRKL